MNRYQKIILGVTVLLTFISILVFVGFLFSGRENVQSIETARRSFENGNYEAARPILIQIVANDPGNEAAYRMLAEISESEHDYPVATALYERVADLNQFDETLRPKLAEMYAVMGRFEDVRFLLEEGFENDELSRMERLYYLEALAMTDAQTMFEEHLDPLKTDSSAQLFLLYGIRSLDQQDYAKAAELFDEVLQRDPPVVVHYKALSLGAIAAAMQGNVDRTEQKLIAAAELVPALGAFPLASFYLRNNEQENALVWLETCLDVNAGHVGARLMMTDIYAADEDLEQLNEMLETSESRTREDQECENYLKAAIALLEKRYSDVDLFLSAAPNTADRLGYQSMMLEVAIQEKDLPRISQCVRKIQDADESESIQNYLLVRLAPLLAELLNDDRPIQADILAGYVVPLLDNVDAEFKVPILNMLLLNAIRQKDHIGITNYASRLLVIKPDETMANLAMGEALISLGLPKKALRYLQALPDSPASLYDRAAARLQLGEIEKAEELFRRGWEAFPGDIQLFNAYVNFLLSQEREEEIEPLIAALPDTPKGRYAEASTRAELASRSGDEGAAERHYRTALDILKTLPETFDHRYRKAYLHATLGDDAVAAGIYRELLNESPDDLMIMLNLSETEAALGNAEAAMELAQKAARLYPESPQAKECLNRRQKESE